MQAVHGQDGSAGCVKAPPRRPFYLGLLDAGQPKGLCTNECKEGVGLVSYSTVPPVRVTEKKLDYRSRVVTELTDFFSSLSAWRGGGQSRAGDPIMLARGRRDTSAREMLVEPSFCRPGRPRIALGAADVNRAPADRLGGCCEVQKELSLSPPEPVVCKGRKTGLIMNSSVEKGPDGMERLEKFWASERGASTSPRVRFSQLAGSLKPAGIKIACASASDSGSEISSTGDSTQRSRPRNSRVCIADANSENKADAEGAACKLRQLSAGKSAGATCKCDEDIHSSDMELCGSSLQSSAQKNDEVLASASKPVCFQLRL